MMQTRLRERLIAAIPGSQRRSQAERIVAFLRFVAYEMRDKRHLRRCYARNTIASYRRHLVAAGIAPIGRLEELSWVMEAIGFTAPDIRAGCRLLWVLNDDRHHSNSHAMGALYDLVYEAGAAERAMNAEAA